MSNRVRATGLGTRVKRPVGVLAAMTTLATAGFSLGMAAPSAYAADISSGLTNVTSTINGSDTAQLGSDSAAYSVEYDACIPASAEPGDTFSINLPSQLQNWPTAVIPVNSVTDSSDTLANIQIQNGVATYTLTANGANESNVCFRSNYGGRLADDATAGATTLKVTDISGAVIASKDITVVAAPDVQVPQQPYKIEYWNNGHESDQCRTETTDCLTATILTSGGAHGTIHISDPAGVNWQFDPSSVSVFKVVYNADGSRTNVDYNDHVSNLSASPSQVSLDVDTSALQSNENIEVHINQSALAPGGKGLVTYSNTATVTEDGQTTTVSDYSESTWVAASATGAHVTLRKTDAAGHDADTDADRVTLPDGSTGIVLTIVNDGDQNLSNLAVTDVTTVGNASTSNVDCDFSALGGPSSGNTWDGPFAPNASFTCTLTLSGVSGDHTDVAAVTAKGSGGDTVTSSNPYNAYTPAATPPSYNLSLTKAYTGAATVHPGDKVTYTLTPHNDGPNDAVSGWSVKDIIPAGETLTAMSGDGYDCTVSDATCVADGVLAANSDGKPITVTATLNQDATGVQHNVAYVAPGNQGYDETNPLTVPTTSTDTSTTPTDNDSQADVTVTPVTPAPSYNLTLTKALQTAGPFTPGETVTYTLTPHNDGPDAAVSGWSVKDIIPAGETIQSMTGSGYSCTVSNATCVSSVTLAGKANGNPITVKAMIEKSATGVLHNVAYVSPSNSQGYDETNPLTVPTTSTDTSKTPTDNDSQANLTVTPVAVKGSVSVGDYVWYDANHDGIQQASEKGIPGVTMTLTGPDGKSVTDVNGKSVAPVKTDANGKYLFGNLPELASGQHYTVSIGQLPAGYAPTLTGKGTTATDSSTGKAVSVLPLSADKSQDLTLDFGVWKPVTRTYTVQADKYMPNIAGNAKATTANQVLVASLDNDGVLKFREDQGNCKAASTCMWNHTTHTFVTFSVTGDASHTPTTAELMAAYNAKAPAGYKVTTSSKTGTVSGTVTEAWLLGQGATTANPWAASHNVNQVFLARA